MKTHTNNNEITHAGFLNTNIEAVNINERGCQ